MKLPRKSRRISRSRTDGDCRVERESHVYGRSAATDSAPVEVGFCERGQLSRQRANQRRSHFQTTGPTGCDRSTFLLLDDILDSGHTLAAIREKLETARPRSIRSCVLLSKKKPRARSVHADYVGFEIEDEFVVGYGLDFMERYRNLPCIGVLRKELIADSTG